MRPSFSSVYAVGINLRLNNNLENSVSEDNQVIDLSNQVSVFRRVTVARNQELIAEEERFNNQMATTTGNKTNIENINSDRKYFLNSFFKFFYI